MKNIHKFLILVSLVMFFFENVNAQKQLVIFKGTTNGQQYDGYTVSLFAYDVLEDMQIIESKIEGSKFEIKAPFNGPGTYVFMSGFELEKTNGYKPFMIVVDRPGVVHIKANMELLANSEVNGSIAQNIINRYKQETEEKMKPIIEQWRAKYGVGIVDSSDKYRQDPKYKELVGEYKSYQAGQGYNDRISILMKLSKRYSKSIAIPFLALTSELTQKDQMAIYQTLSPVNKKSRYGKILFDAASLVNKSSIGTQVPDFALIDSSNNRMALKDLLKDKKYILIDFWASWCSPCREEIPKLKGIYKKFKDKGLEIWGISTDEKQDNWLQALQQDKPDWPQAWDNGKNDKDKIADTLFSVKYLPSTYLLDAQGKIVAKDLRGEELEKKIEELLNSELLNTN